MSLFRGKKENFKTIGGKKENIYEVKKRTLKSILEVKKRTKQLYKNLTIKTNNSSLVFLNS